MSDLKPCPFESGAFENLKQYQVQLDEDGIEVAVSRQALAYCLSWIEDHRANARPQLDGDAVEALRKINNARHSDNAASRLVPDRTNSAIDAAEKAFSLTYFSEDTPALQQQSVDVPSLEEELAEETAQMWEQGKDYPKIDVAGLLKEYIPADHKDAKDPWLTENEVNAYNMAVHDMLRKGCLRTPLEKVEETKPDNWDMECVVLEKSVRKGLFTETYTVHCGRWQIENYMRQGYVPNWIKTDEVRGNNAK